MDDRERQVLDDVGIPDEDDLDDDLYGDAELVADESDLQLPEEG